MEIIINDTRNVSDIRVKDSLNIKHIPLSFDTDINKVRDLLLSNKINNLSDVINALFEESDDLRASIENLMTSQPELSTILKHMLESIRQLELRVNESAGNSKRYALSLLHDISETGMSFYSRRPLEANHLIIAEVEIIEPTKQYILALSKVMSSTLEGAANRCLINVEFESLSTEHLEILKDYIDYKMENFS